VIFVHPKSQQVVEGNPVTLEVKAGGNAPLFYQWYCDNRPLYGMKSFIMLLLTMLLLYRSDVFYNYMHKSIFGCFV